MYKKIHLLHFQKQSVYTTKSFLGLDLKLEDLSSVSSKRSVLILYLAEVSKFQEVANNCKKAATLNHTD